MTLASKLRTLPGRVATGAYILHAGMEKWQADEERAAGLHKMAAGAFPQLEQLSPAQFVKALSLVEMATGGALLLPVVPESIAGLALSSFSGGLLTLYWKTPGLRRENSPWPSQAGLAISKDVWMFAIGLGLLAEAATGACRKKKKRRG